MGESGSWAVTRAVREVELPAPADVAAAAATADGVVDSVEDVVEGGAEAAVEAPVDADVEGLVEAVAEGSEVSGAVAPVRLLAIAVSAGVTRSLRTQPVAPVLSCTRYQVWPSSPWDLDITWTLSPEKPMSCTAESMLALVRMLIWAPVSAAVNTPVLLERSCREAVVEPAAAVLSLTGSTVPPTASANFWAFS